MTLRSTSEIKILDLLCEGPIGGFATPITPKGQHKSILLNDNPAEIKNSEFEDGQVEFIQKIGNLGQGLKGEFLNAKNTEIITINEEIGTNYSETLKADNTVESRDYGGGQIVKKIQLTSTDLKIIRINFTIPALFSTAMEGIASGQLFSAKINIVVKIKGKGQAFTHALTKTIHGVTTTNYQFQEEIELIDSETDEQPFGAPPYSIKIIKNTTKNEKKDRGGELDYDIRKEDLVKLPTQTPFGGKRANRLICSSFELIAPAKPQVSGMALVGLTLSSEDFPQLPTRQYLIKGKKVRIFSNATSDPDTGRLTFDGEFDGNFLQSVIEQDDGEVIEEDQLVWTTCPVCIFIDMLTNSRYGAGDFVSTENISLVDLYPLAQYCNELVDIPDDSSADPNAITQEPRFAMNTIIGNQTSAYKLLQNMASVFRGMTYWASNTVNLGADHGNLGGEDAPDIDPVHLYNNSNVIEGVFSYSGTSVKTRSTKLRINYNDPKNDYKIDQVIIEDQSLIDKFGVQEKEIVAFGCTSKYQAQRMGQYMLRSEELDAEIVTFSTGLDGLFVLPGQVFAVSDLMRAGQRVGGRVSSATSTVITTDQTVALPAGDNKKLSCILSDGTLSTKNISSTSGTTITVSSAFDPVPLAQSVYVISTDNVQKQKFRCIDIKDNNNGTYTITGVQHNDSIYKLADNTTGDTKLELDERDISTFNENPQKPTDLVVTFSFVKVNNNTVNRALFQWSRGTNGASTKFNIRLDINGKSEASIDNFNQTTFEKDNLPEGATYTFQVEAVSIFNKLSGPVSKEGEVPSVTVNVSDGTVITEAEVPPDPE